MANDNTKDNVVNFPGNGDGDVVFSSGVDPSILEKAEERGLKNFVDFLSRQILEDVTNEMSFAGVETDTEQFKSDCSVLLELITAIVFRSFGADHKLVSVIDGLKSNRQE
jgi:hypothetical protein